MKRLLLTASAVFYHSSGVVLSDSHSVGSNFWARYLRYCERVVVVGRGDTRAPSDGAVHCSSESVDFCLWTTPSPLSIRSWSDALRSVGGIWRALRAADFVSLRLPCLRFWVIGLWCIAVGRPYGVEVVGHIGDSLRHSGKRIPFPFIRLMENLHVWICSRATSGLYVSEDLALAFPSHGQCFVASNVELASIDFAETPKFSVGRDVLRVISIGSMDRAYKGQDVLIETFASLPRDLRKRTRLILVGDGRRRVKLERMATALAVAKQVEFAGRLPRREVFVALRQADVFVLPSLTEGMPRALIEACASGLPSIASDVGGIDGMLPPASLVPPGDVEALAQRLADLLVDPNARRQLAARCLEAARAYEGPRLERQRDRYFAAATGGSIDAR